jgi:hypothetical protein
VLEIGTQNLWIPSYHISKAAEIIQKGVVYAHIYNAPFHLNIKMDNTTTTFIAYPSACLDLPEL